MNELSLVPICYSQDHKVQEYENNYDNLCSVCNQYISIYKCDNCEYTRCINCQEIIDKENEEIIDNMKNILISEFDKITEEIGPSYDIIFYKKNR